MHPHPIDRPSLAPVCVPLTWQDVARLPAQVTVPQYLARLADWLPVDWLAAHESDVRALLWEHPDILSLCPATGAAYLTGAYHLPRVDNEALPAWLAYALPVRPTL